METTLIKNNTSTAILLTCSRSGAVLYLNARGSISYLNLDLELEDIRGFLHADFKVVSACPEEGHIKNPSTTHAMCVQGRIGATDVPVIFVPPLGAADLTPYLPAASLPPPVTSLHVFSSPYEFFVSNVELQKLDLPEYVVALAIQRTKLSSSTEDNPVITFMLTRLHHPAGLMGKTFEISSTSSCAPVAAGHSQACAVSCKTLPNVALCATTKAGVALLVCSSALLLLALVGMPLYVVACRKADARK